MLHSLINLLPGPRTVVRGALGVLEPTSRVVGWDIRNEIISLRTEFAEATKVQERIKQVAARAGIEGEDDLGYFCYHTAKSHRVVIEGGTFSPFKITLSCRDAVAYAVDPGDVESRTRLNVSVEEHRRIIQECDYKILEEIYGEHSYPARVLSAAGVSLGAGLLTWTLASPTSAVAVAVAMGCVACTATHILIISTVLLLLSLAAYAAVRHHSSRSRTEQAVQAMVGLPDVDNLQIAANLAITFFRREMANNRKSTSHIMGRVVRHIKYTDEGDKRWFTSWEASYRNRIALLEKLSRS